MSAILGNALAFSPGVVGVAIVAWWWSAIWRSACRIGVRSEATRHRPACLASAHWRKWPSPLQPHITIDELFELAGVDAPRLMGDVFLSPSGAWLEVRLGEPLWLDGRPFPPGGAWLKPGHRLSARTGDALVFVATAGARDAAAVSPSQPSHQEVGK